jgi:hypothetical protein
VEGDAGLMRGVELDLLADGSGEDNASSQEQTEGQEEKREARWAAGRSADREVNHVMSSFWIIAVCRGCAAL